MAQDSNQRTSGPIDASAPERRTVDPESEYTTRTPGGMKIRWRVPKGPVGKAPIIINEDRGRVK